MKKLRKFISIALTAALLMSIITVAAAFSSSADSIVYKWPKTGVKGDTWKSEGMYNGSWGDGLMPLYSADADGNVTLSFKKKMLFDEYAKAAQLNLDFHCGSFIPEANKAYYVLITNYMSVDWKVKTNWSGDGNVQPLPANKTTKVELRVADNTTLVEMLSKSDMINFTIQSIASIWPNGELAEKFMAISPIYVDSAPLSTGTKTTTTTTKAGNTDATTAPDTHEYIKYANLSDGSLAVEPGKDIKLSQNITIPSSVGGKPVKAVNRGCFSECESLKSITLPEGLSEIGDYAFSNCTSLTNIVIPKSVTKIGVYAFNNCKLIKSADISENVKSIGYGAFDLCDSLQKITVSPSNTVYSSENGILFDKNKTSIIRCPSGIEASSYAIPSSVTSIGACAFKSCSALTQITVTNKVTSIGESAFAGCKSLKKFTIPSGVKYIDDYVFAYCASLEEMTIPGNVSKIGDSAFWACSSLRSVIIQEGVISINDYAFEDCPVLRFITIPKSTVDFGNNIFNNSSKVSINCYKNSSAEKYASENRITYEILSDVKYGDANGDGKITAADVLIIRKSIAGQGVTLNKTAADVNCDGKLTAADVLLIRKSIAGQKVTLGKA